MGRYMNSQGNAFYSPEAHVDTEGYFKKNVKYWVGIYHGFGIDREVVDNEVRGQHRGIRFILKKDLVDFYRGRNTVACEKGEYVISMEDFEKYSTLDELGNFGQQFFVPAYRCQKVK